MIVSFLAGCFTTLAVLAVIASLAMQRARR